MEKEELELDKEGPTWLCHFCNGYLFMLISRKDKPRDLIIVCSSCQRVTELRLDG